MSALIAILLTVSAVQPEIEPAPNIGDAGIILLEAVPALFLSVFIHESGHALSGLAMGMEIDRFQPHITQCAGKWAWGCTSVRKRRISLHEKIVFSGSGMLGTRLFSEGVDLALNNIPMHPRLKQAGAVLYFITRLESTGYVLLCSITKCGEASDPRIIADSLSRNNDAKQWIYVGMAAVMILDFILDWDEITNNWNRLWVM